MKPILYMIVSFSLMISHIQAQTPTFSLEVIALNGIPLPHKVQQIIAAPGEQFTMEVYLRDWSPDGEQIRAYQVEMDDKSYSSGDAGTIQPIGLASFRLIDKDNNENAFIDMNHPNDIHGGQHCIRLTDTRNAPGYRFLSVVIDSAKAPACPQDGSKFYAGTIKMEISEDAKGTFQLAFLENSDATGMMNQNSDPISPMHYEKLTVVINSEVAQRRYVSSYPPDGAIDHRISLDHNHQSWNNVQITFRSEQNEISADDFSVSDNSDNPPHVRNLSSNGKTITLKLGRGIRSGNWTRIKYKPTQQTISIASLPGDVNGDGKRNVDDITTMENVLNGLHTLPTLQTDTNPNPELGCQDMANLIQLLSPAVRTKIPYRLKS